MFTEFGARIAMVDGHGVPIQLKNRQYYARGKRGIVFTALLGSTTVLAKVANPKSDVDTVSNEALMLKLLNKHGIGPAYIGFEDGMMIREFIDGEEIMDWMRHSQKNQIKLVLLAVLEQCRIMDKAGINKLEMTHPRKHVLITRNKPVLIDFERCRFADKPKNVTQVIQWFTSRELSALLAQKNITLDRIAMMAHAKQYKRHYSSIPYRNMVEVIRNA